MEQTPPSPQPLTLSDPPHATSHPLTPEQYRALAPADSPIVVDLGSSLLRAGFAADLDRLGGPRLVYPPWVARARDGKRGLDPRKIHIGYEATHPSSRVTARSAFDGPLPANAWALERVLDGTLDRLGLSQEHRIVNPFLLTEPLCCPNAVRSAMYEILFEGYDAPGVSLGLAPVFSYSAQNRHSASTSGLGSPLFPKKSALVIDFGHHSTNVLAIVDGNCSLRGARRVSLGGYDMADTFMRRLQLANPNYTGALGAVESMSALRNQTCYVAEDYAEEMRRLWNDEDYYEKQRLILKMPVADDGKVELSAEEQAKKAKARSEMGKRLYEMMKAKREAAAAAKAAAAEELKAKNEEDGTNADDSEHEEDSPQDIPFEPEEAAKLEPLLERAYQYRNLEALRETNEDDFYLKIAGQNMKSVADMELRKKKREKALETAIKQIGEEKSATIERAYLRRKSEDELLATADSDLSSEEVKAKRKLRSLRASAIFREQVRRQKEEEELTRKAAEEELRKRKEGDPHGYISDLLKERYELEGRVRQRAAANEAGSDRRSQAARHRMKLLAQQISPAGNSNKREEDTFGAKDSDWDVYREIEEGAADEEEEDQERLKLIEKDLLEMAPRHAARNRKPPRGAATLFLPPKNEEDVYIVNDRVRTPEIVWQPSLVGNEHVGLSEAILLVVNAVPEIHRRELVQNTFLTGGSAQYSGLVERVRAEMICNLPCKWNNDIKVSMASDPLHDAWRGAACFAASSEFSKSLITKAEYEEMGVGYLREHAASNTYISTPVADRDQDKKRKKKKL